MEYFEGKGEPESKCKDVLPGYIPIWDLENGTEVAVFGRDDDKKCDSRFPGCIVGKASNVRVDKDDGFIRLDFEFSNSPASQGSKKLIECASKVDKNIKWLHSFTAAGKRIPGFVDSPVAISENHIFKVVSFISDLLTTDWNKTEIPSRVFSCVSESDGEGPAAASGKESDDDGDRDWGRGPMAIRGGEEIAERPPRCLVVMQNDGGNSSQNISRKRKRPLSSPASSFSASSSSSSDKSHLAVSDIYAEKLAEWKKANGTTKVPNSVIDQLSSAAFIGAAGSPIAGALGRSNRRNGRQ